MKMLTLLYFVTSKQAKSKRYPQNPIKSVSTTNTTHQEYLSRCTFVPLFLQTGKNMRFSALTSPFWPYLYTRKTVPGTSFFGFTKPVWFEHENTFQNYLVKKVMHTIQNASRRYISTIHGFSTLVANSVYKLGRPRGHDFVSWPYLWFCFVACHTQDTAAIGELSRRRKSSSNPVWRLLCSWIILDWSQHAVKRRDCSVKPSFSCISPPKNAAKSILVVEHSSFSSKRRSCEGAVPSPRTCQTLL